MTVSAFKNTSSCPVEWDAGGHHAKPLLLVVPFSPFPSASKSLTSMTPACDTHLPRCFLVKMLPFQDFDRERTG